MKAWQELRPTIQMASAASIFERCRQHMIPNRALAFSVRHTHRFFLRAIGCPDTTRHHNRHEETIKYLMKHQCERATTHTYVTWWTECRTVPMIAERQWKNRCGSIRRVCVAFAVQLVLTLKSNQNERKKKLSTADCASIFWENQDVGQPSIVIAICE